MANEDDKHEGNNSRSYSLRMPLPWRHFVACASWPKESWAGTATHFLWCGMQRHLRAKKMKQKCQCGHVAAWEQSGHCDNGMPRDANECAMAMGAEVNIRTAGTGRRGGGLTWRARRHPSTRPAGPPALSTTQIPTRLLRRNPQQVAVLRPPATSQTGLPTC